jgi:prepilin-type N-terminal cleavage/methylation domain-containing protein
MRRNRRSMQHGFTLVEVIVVTGLIAGFGGIMVTILFSVFQSTAKVQSITNVRTTGNYALTRVSSSIQTAKDFEGIGQNQNSLQVNCTRSMSDPTVTLAPIQYSTIQVTTSSNEIVTYACAQNPRTITANGIPIIDSTKVTMTECYFTCSQTYTSEWPRIRIRFSLLANPAQPGDRPMTFDTSFVLRNLVR